MKKIILLVLVIFMSIPSINTKAAGVPPYATWLWNPWVIKTDEQKIINFLTKNKVKQVYLQIDQDLPIETYQTFITKATNRKIEIYALDGAPDWISKQGKNKLASFFQWVKNYQTKSKINQQIKGIHLDVEPYLLKSWNNNREEAVLSYQEVIKKSAAITKTLNLSFGIDIPFWFDTIALQNKYGKTNLAKWAIAQTDAVTIMAYRNTASGENGIKSIVKNEMLYAKNANKTIYLAVETGKSKEGPNISFYQTSNHHMKNELEKVSNAYPQVKMNFAVHYLDSWMLLK